MPFLERAAESFPDPGGIDLPDDARDCIAQPAPGQSHSGNGRGEDLRQDLAFHLPNQLRGDVAVAS